ncbi:MAG: pectinesterase family protein [Clostridiales bacterium]|nr:pectinesterase family protein [Clostridiales bacterium]
MKKKASKIISLILTAALAVSSVTFVSFADEAEEETAVEAVLDEAASDSALEAETDEEEAAVVSSVETDEVVEADLDPYYSEQNFSYTEDFSLMNQEYNMTQYIDLAYAGSVYGNSTTKIQLQNKAVYATLEDAVSTGTATFTADVLSDDVDSDYAGRAFRIYLESAQTATTNGVGDAAFDQTNIFYHLTDIGSTVYVVTEDSPTASSATSNMTAIGSFETGTWYRFVIEIDLDNGSSTTYMYKHSSDGTYNDDLSSMTLVGSLTTDTVTGKTVSLKQMRLVRTAKTYVYFDNVSLAYDSTANEADSTTETTTESSSGDDDDDVIGSSFLWWFDEVNNGGTVSPGDYTAGNGTADITVVPGLNGESYSAQSGATLEYTDGTTHSGYWASNRPDSAGSLTTLPTAGSSYYFKLNASGTVTVYNYVPSGKNFYVKDFDESLTLVNTTTTGSMDSNGNDSLTFAGEEGHTYLVTTGGTNGLRFYGFKFLVDDPVEVPVSVTVGEDVDFSQATISFTDVDTEAVYATVVDGQTSVTLNAGHTYEISIDDGGIDVDYNGETEFTFAGTEESIDLTLTNVPDVTLTGTITSADSDNAADVVTSITFTKMSDESVSYSTTDIDASAGTYSITIKPGEYNTSVETTDGSTTYDRVSVAADGDNVNEIYLEFEDTSVLTMYDEIQKSSSVVAFSGFSAHSAQYGVSGKVGSTITVPASAGQTLNITMSYDGEFNVYDNGTGEVVNTGTSLKASYEVSDTATAVTIEVTATGNVVSGSSGAYVVSVEYVEAALDYVSELSVPGDYDTLNEAIAAIKAMDRPDGEDGRVTITLTDDLQEQVYMDADYVTLDGQGKYEVNWYYGVGSAYYSVDSSGLYSETLFRDAYSTRDASGSLWGGVMLVYGDYFLAHDVTFRNTYNYYVTEKEVADGVTPTDGKNERTLSTDVTVSTMRERSNALYTYGNYCEYKNCNILSSQDTLGINGTLSNYTYFKDCTIGGNCDYICGAGTMLFDNCTLQWKTEGASSLGYITAPKIHPYIFRNCVITQDGANYVASSTGFYGRPWASTADGGAYAIYYQCETNDLIRYDGWYDMSSNSADEANFYEYNNLASDGSVFMSTRGKDLNDEAYADILAAVEGDAVIDGMLGGWTPVYYESSDESVGFGSDEIELSANTYDIDVALMKASDITSASMAASCIESATLTVNEDGTATLTVNLTSVTLAGATAYGTDWKVYTDYETGETVDADVLATNDEGYPTQISFTIPDNSADGVYLQMAVAATGMTSTSDAYLAIDYSSATIAGEDSGNGLRGDVDQNGIITANDAACLLTYVLDNENLNPNWNVSAAIADVAGSVYGEIAADDVAAIMAKVLNGAYQFKDLNGSSSSGGGSSSEETSEEASEETTETTTEAQADDTTETTTEATEETTEASDYAYSFVVDRDVSASFSTGDTVYSDDALTILAEQPLTLTEIGDTVIGDYTYTNCIKSDGSLTVTGNVDGVGSKSWRVHSSYTAAQDCTVTIAMKVVANKLMTVAASSGDGTYTSVFYSDGTSEAYNAEVTFTLAAGETVYLMGQGTNPEVYAVNVVTEGGSEESTEEATAEETTETTTEAAAEETTEAASEEATEGEEVTVEDVTYSEDGLTYTVGDDGSVVISGAVTGTAANAQYAIDGADSGVVTLEGSITVDGTVSSACTYLQVLGGSGSEVIGLRSDSGNAMALRLGGSSVTALSPSVTWTAGVTYDYVITADLETGYVTMTVTGSDGSSAEASGTLASLVGDSITGLKITSKSGVDATITATKPTVTLSESTGETGDSDSDDDDEEEDTISTIESDYVISYSDLNTAGDTYYAIYGTIDTPESYIRLKAGNGIIVNVNAGATITVNAKSANSDYTRALIIYNGTDTTGTIVYNAPASEDSNYADSTYTVTEAGYYLISADNGINVKTISVTY